MHAVRLLGEHKNSALEQGLGSGLRLSFLYGTGLRLRFFLFCDPYVVPVCRKGIRIKTAVFSMFALSQL